MPPRKRRKKKNPPHRPPKERPDWWNEWIEQLRKVPVIYAAHDLVGNRDPQAHNYWVNRYPHLKKEFEEAKRAGFGKLEVRAFEMAELDGAMMRFLLTKHLPETYGDKTTHEHTHNLPPALEDAMARFYGGATPKVEPIDDDEPFAALPPPPAEEEVTDAEWRPAPDVPRSRAQSRLSRGPNKKLP